MPQGSHMKGGKSNPKKQKITKASKKGSSITKKTPKKTVVEKKKLKKALETAIKANIVDEIRGKASGSTFSLDTKKVTAVKGKKGKKK